MRPPCFSRLAISWQWQHVQHYQSQFADSWKCGLSDNVALLGITTRVSNIIVTLYDCGMFFFVTTWRRGHFAKCENDGLRFPQAELEFLKLKFDLKLWNLRFDAITVSDVEWCYVVGPTASLPAWRSAVWHPGAVRLIRNTRLAAWSYHWRGSAHVSPSCKVNFPRIVVSGGSFKVGRGWGTGPPNPGHAPLQIF